MFILQGLSAAESFMVSDLIEDLRQITESNSCVDEYTASLSGNLLKKLGDAESEVNWNSLYFLILLIMASIELAILSFCYLRETIYSEWTIELVEEFIQYNK